MYESSRLKEWQKYPENLNSESHDVDFAYNHANFRENLSAESARLFVPKSDPIVVKVVEFGVQGESSAIPNTSSVDPCSVIVS